MSSVAEFDADRLPHAARYVASLPQGLDSFPDCRVRAIVNQVVSERHPEVFSHPGVPDAFRAMADTQFQRGDWIPEVVGTTTRLLVRDALHRTDEEYFEWIYDVSAEVFSRPFYRVLMTMVSPGMAVVGAGKRWAAFREGTTLHGSAGTKSGQLTLTHPDGLYDPFVFRSFSESFRATLDATRAKDAVVELDDVEPGVARWRLRWA